MKECCKSIIVVKGKMMKVRKRDEQSFGWRLMKIREDREMSQKEVVDKLAAYDNEGIPRSVPALSQLELGMTKRVHVDLLLALSEILNVSVAYLITGVEPESPTAWSEEAEQVARLIDQMLPRSRQLIKTIAKNLVIIDNEQREAEVNIAVLLQENLNLLNNGDRKIAVEYIHRMGMNGAKA